MAWTCPICGYESRQHNDDAPEKCPDCGVVFPVTIESRDKPSRYDLETLDDSNTVALYFREIDRVSLLTAEDEVDLAKRIEAGKAAAERLAHDPGLDEVARVQLRNAVASGQSARHRLIESNTRLVVSIAKRYLNRGVPLGDLIQEGNLGLMEAVERFDHRRGTRFATYATWWIRQSVARALGDQAWAVRLPAHITQQQGRLARVQNQLQQELGRAPTVEEIATDAQSSPQKVRLALETWRNPLSLEDVSFGSDDEESQWVDYLEDDSAPRPIDAAMGDQLKAELSKALTSLTPREERVLEMRFGLRDGRDYRLSEIAQRFGLTRERIRQIEGDALRKLRQPRRAELLRDFNTS
jgi:RNA polymerase primary sigma factor